MQEKSAAGDYLSNNVVTRKITLEQNSEREVMPTPWDHSSREEFVTYYAEKSAHPAQLAHFRSLRNAILRILEKRDGPGLTYDVVDIGCNAGGQCSMWAEAGHRIHGLDVNKPLLNLARKRAELAGHEIDYKLGSATELPWPDESMNVCIATELLEHVSDWRICLSEFGRILRPGGVLFLTTTNAMCPHQCEFNLPLYSWYPARAKHYFERLAVTTRPELANHAIYPAVHWFTPYGLARELGRRGFSSLDRFDIADTTNKSTAARLLLQSIRLLPPLRFLAHFCFAGTTTLALKR
jgi:2-polyprenyl-3-methyl-5-hydroxy-6-metoxy-1,4-benzoquinol methylase